LNLNDTFGQWPWRGGPGYLPLHCQDNTVVLIVAEDVLRGGVQRM
jgi:hypothetical protein